MTIRGRHTLENATRRLCQNVTSLTDEDPQRVQLSAETRLAPMTAAEKTTRERPYNSATSSIDERSFSTEVEAGSSTRQEPS